LVFEEAEVGVERPCHDDNGGREEKSIEKQPKDF